MPLELDSEKTIKELREESDYHAREIETKVREEILKKLRKGNISAREMNDLVRSYSVAKSSAYPEADPSSLQVNLPATMLKPIEMAIRGVSKKSGGHNPTVKKESPTQSNS